MLNSSYAPVPKFTESSSSDKDVKEKCVYPGSYLCPYI